MQMKTIYISLPITGYEESERRQKCEKAKEELHRIYGDDIAVVSPFECSDMCRDRFESPTYGEFMGIDIAYIIDHCDAVYFLADPKITSSKGVRLEYAAATVYGKEIML